MRRRAFCRLLGVAGTAGAAGCIERRYASQPAGNEAGMDTDTPAATDEWPTFGFDHGHTSVLEDASGPATGEVAWTAIGDAPTVLCSPTVSDGTVFVGSAANAVHAFDAESGAPRWEHDTVSYVSTAPSVVGDTVYTADADGVVYALDAADGTDRWTHDTGHNFHSRAVAVHGDTLIAGTAGTMPAAASGNTDETKAGLVVGLDTATGEERWRFSGPGDWFSGPAVGDGRIYVGNHDGTVTALDPANGEKLWQWIPLAGDGASVLAPPTYADGTVYVGVHGLGRLVALDATDGSRRWSTDLKAPNVKSSPAVDGDRVYLGATGSESSDYDGPDEPTGGRTSARRTGRCTV